MKKLICCALAAMLLLPAALANTDRIWDAVQDENGSIGTPPSELYPELADQTDAWLDENATDVSGAMEDGLLDMSGQAEAVEARLQADVSTVDANFLARGDAYVNPTKACWDLIKEALDDPEDINPLEVAESYRIVREDLDAHRAQEGDAPIQALDDLAEHMGLPVPTA